LPVSEPSGSGGVSIETTPIFEAAGQAIAFCVPLPNWASVQVCRPLLAAEGLMPMPSGSVTLACLVCELACLVLGCRISAPLGTSNGTSTATDGPDGESVRAVPGSTESEGS
jgi:hypothetical protein